MGCPHGHNSIGGCGSGRFRLASLVDYKCYRLESKDERPDLNQPMLLKHWNPVFKGRTENVVVREPSLLCTPVTKTTR
jgi:hypothetical protein